MNLYEGNIIYYNGKFGFIKFQLGEAYFHKSKLSTEQISKVKKGVLAKFSVIRSKKKNDTWEVLEFSEFLEVTVDEKILDKADCIGKVTYFNESKGFGFLSDKEREYFFHVSKILNSHLLRENDYCIFHKVPSSKKHNSFEANGIFVIQKDSANLLELLRKYFEILGTIDNKIKYIQVRETLIKLSSTEQSTFIKRAYEKADEKRKCFFWLDDYVNEVNLEALSEIMIEVKDFSDWIYDKSYEKIFKKVTKEKIVYLMFTFLEKLQTIDDEIKYNQITNVYKNLSSEYRTDFIQKCYDIASEKWKYELLNKYSIPNPDLEQIERWYIDKQKFFDYIIISHIPNDKQIVLYEFIIAHLEKIDNEFKYKQVRDIYQNLSQENQLSFIQKTYEIAEGKWKYELLRNYSIPNPDIEHIYTCFAERQNDFYFKIISTLSKDKQVDFYEYFLIQLEKIDNETKYYQTTIISQNLSPENQPVFIQKAYEIADIKGKCFFWIDEYSKELNFEHLLEVMIDLGTNLQIDIKETYYKIFKKFNKEEKLGLGLKFLEKLKKIDDEKKYQKIEYVYQNLPLEDQSTFIQKVYEIADENWKYELLRNYSISNPDIKLIIKNYIEKQENFDFVIISKIDAEQQLIFCDFFLDYEKCINNQIKYTKVIELLFSLESDNKKIFIKKAFRIFNEDFKTTFLLNFSKFIEPNISEFERWLIIARFLLIKPKKNKYYGEPLIGLMEFDIAYVTNNREVFDSIALQRFNLCILKDFIDYSKYFPSDDYNNLLNYVSGGLNTLNFREILSSEDLDEYVKIQIVATIRELDEYFSSPYDEKFFNEFANLFIKDIELKLEYYLSNEDKFIEALINLYKIDNERCNDFINKNSAKLNNYIKMKLWLYDIYDIFDYTTYGFYYFRLDKFEKKIYNQKARYLMQEKIKEMIIAERIPWEYIKTDENGINYYRASWRSIWFLDKNIKFCVKTDDKKNIFSENYYWDFSEESFNFLYSYLSRKQIKDLEVQEKNERILNVMNLELLKEHIYKSQLQKIINERGYENLSSIQENEVKRIINLYDRNECIKYLSEISDTDKKVIRVFETIFDPMSGRVSLSISFLFTVTISEYSFVIWESLEFDKSKATHIFKPKKDEYDCILQKINDFLKSTTKVRSKLNSETFEEKKDLRYLCRIDHDYFNFDNWKRRIDEILKG